MVALTRLNNFLKCSSCVIRIPFFCSLIWEWFLSLFLWIHLFLHFEKEKHISFCGFHIERKKIMFSWTNMLSSVFVFVVAVVSSISVSIEVLCAKYVWRQMKMHAKWHEPLQFQRFWEREKEIEIKKKNMVSVCVYVAWIHF